jgi:hypothetical protein
VIGGARGGLLLLTTLSGFLVLVHSLMLGAGLLGRLTAGGLGLLLVGAGTVAVVLWRRRDHGRAHVAAVKWSAARAFAPLAALVAMIVWAWPHLAEATRLWIWDDYTYHMVYPALWLREHAIAAPSPAESFTMQAWYPLSASVVATWFMAPWPGSRGEALAWVSLTGPLYAGLVLAAAAVLLARLGARPGAWAVPAVLFATSPRIGIMASSFSDADLAQAATLLAAFAFAVPRGGDERERELGVDAIYAGLLSGLALGVKVSTAPAALVVLGLLALRTRERPVGRWRAAAGVTLIVAAGWIVTAGYWYARNAYHTGNPVYPAALLVWPGTTFPETTLLEYARRYGLGRTLRDAVVVYVDWPRTHAILAGAGLVGVAVWRGWSGHGATRSQRGFVVGALALAGAVLVLLPAAPYSAGNAMTFRSGFIHWDSMRYVALVPLMGWVALGFLLDRVGRMAAGVLVVVVLLTSTLVPLASPVALAAVALGALVLPRLRRRATALATSRGRALAAGALALAVAAGVVGWHRTKVSATASAFTREPLFGGVVTALDQQPPGARVAVFGDQWVYPTFGARHHLHPVRLDGDGHVATTPVGDAMAPGDPTVDPARLRANLAAAGVDLVVIVHLPHPGRSPAWPAQHAALVSVGDAQLLHRDDATAVWRLGRLRRP